MFADVSGFTALCESYTLEGEKGVDALTIELNNYMGKIADPILNSGGDILQFAGDAFLALWKVEKRSDLKMALNIAAKAAITIQDTCDQYKTDKGVTLRVKLALSAGKIFVSFVQNIISEEEERLIRKRDSTIDRLEEAHKKHRMNKRQSIAEHMNFGKDKIRASVLQSLGVSQNFDSRMPIRRRHFVTVGRPVSEVNKAEKYCNPGRIVLSPNAYDLCDKSAMQAKNIEGRFYELKFLKQQNIPTSLPPQVEASAFDEKLIGSQVKESLLASKDGHTYVRECMKLRNDHNVQNKIKEFIMPVVIDKLNDQQQLKYLSELRQVTVVFINLSFRQKLQDKKFYEKQAPKIQQFTGL